MPSGVVDCPSDHDLSVAFVLPVPAPLTEATAAPIGRAWHDSGGGGRGSVTYLSLRRLLI
jgi:hypothetical protein